MKDLKYYIEIAERTAGCSNDPNTKVGCVIFYGDGAIAATGYNSIPHGFPEGKTGEWVNTKYPYVLHSEMMAIVDAKRDLKYCEMLVTLFPCNECAKAIIRSGIKKVYYLDDKYADKDNFIASRKLLEAAGVELEQVNK